MSIYLTFKKMYMHTKLFLPWLLGCSLLLVMACQQQDQKLIGKVEAEITTRQAELGRYEAIGMRLESFQRDLEASFPSLDTAPIDSLKIKANAMVNKERSALAEYKDGIVSLTKRLADYRAGTADKKALDLEYAVVNTSLGNMEKTFQTLEKQDLSMREAYAQRLQRETAK